jgi:hypothetical protein
MVIISVPPSSETPCTVTLARLGRCWVRFSAKTPVTLTVVLSSVFQFLQGNPKRVLTLGYHNFLLFNSSFIYHLTSLPCLALSVVKFQAAREGNSTKVTEDNKENLRENQHMSNISTTQ